MEMVFYNSFTKYYKNITFQAKSLPCRLEIERNGSRYPSDSPFCSRTNFFEIFYFFFRKACPLRSGKGAVFAAGIYVPAAGILGQGYQDAISLFSGFNGLGSIEYDFEKYPTVGFKTDRIVTRLLNDEYENRTWYRNNESGAPVLAVSFTELLPHGLHPDYGMDLAWNYMKQFSRNTETGELVYTPNAK